MPTIADPARQYAALTRSRGRDDPDLVAAWQELNRRKAERLVRRAIDLRADLDPALVDELVSLLRASIGAGHAS